MPETAPTTRPSQRRELESLSDDELIVGALGAPIEDDEEAAELRRRHLDVLFARHYSRVAAWCLRYAGDADRAADLAQDVFLQVQRKLHTFRGHSRFTTWLYSIVRHAAFNDRRRLGRRRDDAPLEQAPETLEPRPEIETRFVDHLLSQRLVRAIQRDLTRTEGQVLYLHYAQGYTLAEVTGMLRLDNKSGAKAFIVSARRKLEKSFGRRLAGRSSRALPPLAATSERRLTAVG